MRVLWAVLAAVPCGFFLLAACWFAFSATLGGLAGDPLNVVVLRIVLAVLCAVGGTTLVGVVRRQWGRSSG
jgi:hypothetical protein